MSVTDFDSPDMYPFIAVEGNKVKGFWEGGYANEFQVLLNGEKTQQGCSQSLFESAMPQIVAWLNNKYVNQQFEADGSTSASIKEPYISA